MDIKGLEKGAKLVYDASAGRHVIRKPPLLQRFRNWRERRKRVTKGNSFTCPNCGSHYFGTSNRASDTGWIVGCNGVVSTGSDEDHSLVMTVCKWSGPYEEHVHG